MHWDTIGIRQVSNGILIPLRFLVLLGLTLGLTTVPAAAKVQLYATLAVRGVQPQECREVSTIVTPLIDEFHGPADWTWILVCDEAAWHRVEQHIGQTDPAGGLILGTTDLENHVTYVRGYYVLHPVSSDELAQPRHTIAHELGHILTRSRDEWKAERQAQLLLREAIGQNR